MAVPSALEAIARDCASPEARVIAEFVQASKRGICAGIGDAGEGEDAESVLPKVGH